MVTANDSRDLVERSDFIFTNECIDIFVDEAGVIVSPVENWVFEHSFQELEVVLQSYYFVIFKGSFHLFDGFCSVVSIGYELSNHRVVESRNTVVLSDTGLDSNALFLLGFLKVLKLSMVRQEVVEGVF